MDVHLLDFRQSSHSIERRSSSVAYLVVGASQEKMEWTGYLIPGDGLLPWGRRENDGTSNRATSGHYLLVRMH